MSCITNSTPTNWKFWISRRPTGNFNHEILCVSTLIICGVAFSGLRWSSSYRFACALWQPMPQLMRLPINICDEHNQAPTGLSIVLHEILLRDVAVAEENLCSFRWWWSDHIKCPENEDGMLLGKLFYFPRHSINSSSFSQSCQKTKKEKIGRWKQNDKIRFHADGKGKVSVMKTSIILKFTISPVKEKLSRFWFAKRPPMLAEAQ